ncbi:RNA polymerase subunit RPO132 [Sheeppox virus]|uniref:DNA-directed RNA polymerase n=2 Tax=Sheeppox virus TaxID=10266 RepID=A0A3F2YKT1_SHEVT|nr:RNA polymerase subunit RPO132 [Sheeppox virus]AOE46477.1 RNA polymerase subunit PRO132 [Sheeppox virus]AOE46626.1 RNA polymerase subunit PRO132 [Sheeppox virus]AVI09612.1 RNA polymerase subunit RPO132 [Sheeppox virus]AVI09746.1 RNA polymerase subunit RPO132 [Sheeppox virus]QEJ79715.1 DNA-dependent RNA polymerase subunit [Sheeppox virus]
MDQRLGYKFLSPDPKIGVFYRPLHFQYKSYSNFINYRLQEILSVKRTLLSFKNDTEKIIIEIDNIKVTPPEYSPIIASIKGKSYDALVTFTVHIYKEVMTKDGTTITKISSYEGNDSHLIKIPLLIGYGNKNPLDTAKYVVPNVIGGVFINKQSVEKVGINLVEKLTTWPKFRVIKPNAFTFSFSSVSPAHILPTKYRHYKILMDLSQLDNCYISSTKTFITVNIILLVQYLSRVSLSFIKHSLSYDMPSEISYLVNTIIESTKELIKTINDFDIDTYINDLIISEYNKQKSQLILEEFKHEMINNFLPHMNDTPNQLKGFYIMSLLRKFIYCIYYTSRYPDRDSMVCHRVLTYGKYFEILAHDELENYIGNIRTDIINNHKNRGTYSVNIHVLTTPGFNHAFSGLLSGKFKKTDGSYRTHSHYSWMQNISIPRSVGYYPDQVKISKMFSVRKYHPSQYAYFCPSDVPERGPQVGLVSQLSVLTSITNICTNEYLELEKKICNYIRSYNHNDISYFETGYYITLENSLIASLNPNLVDDFVIDFRRKKRMNFFGNLEIGITLVNDHMNEIRINIGGGRLIRPFLVIDNGNLIMDEIFSELEFKIDDMTFSDIQKEFPHVIEIVDIEQFTFSNVCESVQKFRALPKSEKYKYHLCDFPAEFKDGYVASSLVGINHNSGPRAILGCAQAKQAISCLSSDIRNKIDNGIHLIYPERPIVISKALETSKIAVNCFGQHVTIALMSYKGINQEDGIIIKKQFVERGGLDIITAKKHQVEIPLENFNNKERVKSTAYSKLESNGLVRLNAFLESGDAIARNISSRTLEDDFVQDNQISFDISDRYTDMYQSRVERVQVDLTDKVKVRVLTMKERRPVLGDKFTSRTSQKGTVAYIADETELPYDENGIKPDVIINSTSIFSRKTVSMLIEVILTSAYASKPYNNDGQNRPICFPSSNETSIDTYLDFAKRCHRDRYPSLSDDDINDKMFCDTILYDPETDKPYSSKIFMGPIYYLRLRHLTQDKATVRCRGKKTKLIRQANEGRRRGGGIKFGEMERDCLIAHGAANTITEVLKDSEEDYQDVYVCENCGDITAQIQGNKVCIRCSKQNLSTILTKVDTTHVAKVFITQMNARGVKVKLEFEKRNPLFYKPLDVVDLSPSFL